MKEIQEIKQVNKNNIKRELLKNYIAASKDEDFIKLVNKLKLKEDTAMKYTSKLQRCVEELKNCKNCKSLNECKNSSKGYVLYPRVDGSLVQVDAVACKYLQKEFKNEESRSISYEEPKMIREASMKNIDLKDKKRVELIKWVKNFYKEYQINPHIKGLYLHGSFGSGKSYILASLLNELASKGYKSIIIYYPEMLRKLKSSFNSSFDTLMNELKTCDLLLIDDIGAETVTSWSRDEILGTILQYRMDESLPTFFTSNLNIEELESHLAETRNSIDILKSKRIIERIKQLTEDIEIISKNRRE